MKTAIEMEIAKTLGLTFPDDDPVWCSAEEVLITGGWRSGKSTRGAFKALTKTLDPKNRLIWLVGPDYLQSREEFRMIFEWCMALQLIAEPIKANCSLPQNGMRWLKTITGCRVETKSAKHPETLASVAPDFVLLCEPGQMPSEVYDMAQGRLIERRGDLWMVGTLENEEGQLRPRWMWYEDMAGKWAQRDHLSRERSFAIPTWSNSTLFPDGIADERLQVIKAKVSDNTWKRRYAAEPAGIENAIFEILYEQGYEEQVFVPSDGRNFHGGAIGVDYGRTFEHPSAIVVVNIDDEGSYWVRAAWLGYRVTPEKIEGMVKKYEQAYGIWQGCCDPNQDYMAQRLGYATATGGMAVRGGRPTEMRFSLTNSLLESRALYFDLYGENVREVLASLRSMRRIADTHGQLHYERPLGDDAGMALTYAIELLRGNDITDGPLPLSFGGTRFLYAGSNDSQPMRA